MAMSVLLTSTHAGNTVPKPDSIPALQREIESILSQKAGRTPGAAVAVVHREGPEWIAGFGLADVSTQRPVTPETLFRIGSVSKAFVALSLLKLQEEGKLRLDDPLRNHAPDLEFANPWESTDPVRLVHLLEHTSGWDNLPWADLAFDPAVEVSLRESLARRPSTRTSRWKPGTRFAYTNMGPSGSAYVVEKITGQRFEDYVAETWFRPLGMKSASYFGTPEVLRQLTQLYRRDGHAIYPYWKMTDRASGAINASANDMANYLQFYLNRGTFNGLQLLPPSAIDRMERPETTLGAREGLTTGYGLHLQTRIREGWVWFGHNGELPGAITDFAYLPELGVGYCIMTNSNDGGTVWAIGRAIRAYLTRNGSAPQLPPAVTLPPSLAHEYNGWYEPINPRNEAYRFLSRMFEMVKLEVGDTGFTLGGLGEKRSFVATGQRLFRSKPEPVATAVFIADRSVGTLIQVGGDTFRRLPGGVAQLQWALCVSPIALGITSFLFALVWIPRRLWGGLRGAPNLRVRVLPLLATLAAFALSAIAVQSLNEPLDRICRFSAWSVSIYILSIAFPVLSAWSLIVAWRTRRASMSRVVWWHSFTTALSLSIVSAYLAYWGAIAVRTWI